MKLSHGTRGGWDNFGPVRKVSKSQANVLHEIDGSPALELYKKYLGEDNSKSLPGSALLFPIVVYPEKQSEQKVVRTVLAVDEENQTMTFAGDVPEGWCAQLMRANFDNLIDAAGEAAQNISVKDDENKLALLVSCVGRKMILGQKTADEVESVIDELGNNSAITGFYSYGEISPLQDVEDSCALHNQTMTVTVITVKIRQHRLGMNRTLNDKVKKCKDAEGVIDTDKLP